MSKSKIEIDIFIECLAKRVIGALEILKEEKDSRKNDGRMKSETREFIMLLDMMDKGVFYLFTLGQVPSLTIQEQNEVFDSGVLNNIKIYCELIENEAG